MGRIVGATLTTHIPRLMIFDDAARQKWAAGSTVYSALDRMYSERLRDLDFDTYLVFDTHWLTTLAYAVNARERHLGTYTSDEVPTFIHDYEYDYLGDGSLGAQIAVEARRMGIPTDAVEQPSLPMHYGTINPMHYLNPQRTRRVLPSSVVYTSSIRTDLQYGAAVRAAVEKSDRRVVLVASGGLSHAFWPFDAIHSHTGPSPEHISSPVNREFDLAIVDLLERGQHRQLLDRVDEFRRRCSPEGRFAHYLMMLSALGGADYSGAGVRYGEYENAVGTGQVILWFDP